MGHQLLRQLFYELLFRVLQTHRDAISIVYNNGPVGCPWVYSFGYSVLQLALGTSPTAYWVSCATVARLATKHNIVQPRPGVPILHPTIAGQSVAIRPYTFALLYPNLVQ